jgi:hypothetical protein
VKLVILAVADGDAETVARLVGSTMFMNGFGVNRPEVIDMPEGGDDLPPLRVTHIGSNGAAQDAPPTGSGEGTEHG